MVDYFICTAGNGPYSQGPNTERLLPSAVVTVHNDTGRIDGKDNNVFDLTNDTVAPEWIITLALTMSAYSPTS